MPYTGELCTVDVGPVSNARILIVDDHPIVRLGLRKLLEHFGNCPTIQEADDGASALEAASGELDAALIDVNLPDMNGVQLLEKLRERYPALSLILISGCFDNAIVEHALNCGVNGFIMKTEAPKYLVRALATVLKGDFACSDEMQKVVDGLRCGELEGSILSKLSERERILFAFIAEGQTLKATAAAMGITYKAADHLKQNVMRKIGAHDRLELARIAIREGLLS